MKKNIILFEDRTICIILYVAVFLMMAFLGGILSVSYILDETGTVANAAFLAGYNWSDWVNSTGGYFYKYGQAPFYFFILKFIKNPYLGYKLMMVENAIAYSFIPVCAYKILRKHLQQEDKIKCALLSFLVSVIPAPLLYSLFARGDVMLIVLSWIVLLFLLMAVDEKERKKQIVFSALIAFFSVYAYMCHSRGIVYIIAVFIIVFYLRFILREKNLSFISYILSLIVFMLMDKKLTSYFKDSIWGTGVKKNTFGSISTNRFEGFFTEDGFRTLLRNCAGWMFSTFSGTLGLAILGFVFAFVLSLYFLSKSQKVSTKEKIIGVYGFLLYVGTLALGILFMFISNYKFVIGEKVKRADRFVYSRYLSPTYAVLVFLALFYILFKSDVFAWKSRITAIVFGASLILYCRSWLGQYTKDIEYSWRNTIDCGVFFDTIRYGNDANKYHGISRALLLMAVVAFFALLIIIIISHFKSNYNRYILVGILGSFLLLSAVSYVKFRFATDIRPMTSVASALNMMDYIQDRTDIPVEYSEVYIDKSIGRYKLMQIAMPRLTVHVRRSINPEDVDDMFIIAKNRVVNESWLDDDCYLLEDYSDSEEQAMLIIKGDNLKRALEERGIELVELPKDYAEEPLEKYKLWFKKDLQIVWKYEWDSLWVTE